MGVELYLLEREGCTPKRGFVSHSRVDAGSGHSLEWAGHPGGPLLLSAEASLGCL